MRSARPAYGLGALGVVLVVSGPVLQVIARSDALLFSLCFAAVQLSCAGVGAVVAARVPRNPVGWVLLAIGLGLGLSVTLGAYGELGINDVSGGLPGDVFAAWLGNWIFVPFVFGGMVVLLHLFPDGRFLSGRWTVVCLVSVAVVFVAAARDALAPGSLEGLSSIENPYAASGAFADVVLAVGSVADPLALPLFAAAILGLGVRLRRSTGVERQQIKWIAFALVLVAIGLAITAAGPEDADAAFLLTMLALAAVPVMAGIAILRYRLYDIDVVINRALVYGALTAILAGAYLGSVLLLQLVLSGVTQNNGLAIAASTLAVAGLFRPARGRIQATVDRRFYRRKYDAARTLESFGSRLRDEVVLDALGAELRAVVGQTMQPAHVSLWLRDSGLVTLSGRLPRRTDHG